MNQIQDHANERSVAISVKATKITVRLLALAMQAFLKKVRSPTEKHGKQSLKSLTKRGGAIENVEVSGENIGAFKKVARKYNIDFALKKDISTEPPNWIVFFKSKDGKALDMAFTEFSREMLKDKTPKPSVDKTLAASKEKAKEKSVGKSADIELPTPKKARRKSEVEL